MEKMRRIKYSSTHKSIDYGHASGTKYSVSLQSLGIYYAGSYSVFLLLVCVYVAMC